MVYSGHTLLRYASGGNQGIAARNIPMRLHLQIRVMVPRKKVMEVGLIYCFTISLSRGGKPDARR